jgi:CheY-like chemotaxis protein
MTAATIALLDNDPAFLTVLHAVLSDEGYRTIRWHACAGDGPPASLCDARPDLVIVELDLGGERRGGWELVKRLRGDPATTDIPAILLADASAALPAQAGVLRAIRCWAVRKPFLHRDLRDLRDLCELLAAIEGALDPARMRRTPGAGAAAEACERAPARNGHRSRAIAGGGGA